MPIEYILFHSTNEVLPLRQVGKSFMMTPEDPDFIHWVDTAAAFGAQEDELVINFARASSRAVIAGSVTTNHCNTNLTTVNQDVIPGTLALVHNTDDSVRVFLPDDPLFPVVNDTFIQLGGDFNDRFIRTPSGTITIISSAHPAPPI